MSQSAKDISSAINAWIEVGHELPTECEGYGHEIKSWGDLIYHLEDEVPKSEDGNRWMSIPGVNGLIRLKLRTGGEGEGDETYAIFELNGYNGGVLRYFRMDGYYRSYDGFYYEDDMLTEVGPVEKPVVFWEPVR